MLKPLTKKSLLTRAGKVIYERGERYFQAGTVGKLRAIKDHVIAAVSGSDFDPYKVVLAPDKKTFDYHCSCLMGEDGAFCKHLVATGLAWLELTRGANGNAATDDTKPIRDYLLTQEKETLTEWLLDECIRNETLHNFLRRRAGNAVKTQKKSHKPPSVKQEKTEQKMKKKIKNQNNQKVEA